MRRSWMPMIATIAAAFSFGSSAAATKHIGDNLPVRIPASGRVRA